jgi:hypothetical protein
MRDVATMVLWPCPFCGEVGVLDTLLYVRCSWCGIQTPVCASAAQAVAAWNRRATNIADIAQDTKKRGAPLRTRDSYFAALADYLRVEGFSRFCMVISDVSWNCSMSDEERSRCETDLRSRESVLGDLAGYLRVEGYETFKMIVTDNGYSCDMNRGFGGWDKL